MRKRYQTPLVASDRPNSDKATFDRLTRLSNFMDRSITLPGGVKIGWDGIIGIVPGIGDLVGAAVSLYILSGAMRLGASKTTIIRMLSNIGIEAIVGAVLFFGDLFDLAFRANSRNMAILNKQLGSSVPVDTPANRWFLIGIGAAFVCIVLLFVYSIFLVISGLFTIIF